MDPRASQQDGKIIIAGLPVSYGESSWLHTRLPDDYKPTRLPDGVLETYRIRIERGDTRLRPHGYDDYVLRRSQKIAATLSSLVPNRSLTPK